MTVRIFTVIASVPEIYYTVAAGRQHDVIDSLDGTEGPLQFAVPFTLSRIVLRFLIPVTIIFTYYMLISKYYYNSVNVSKEGTDLLDLCY